MVVNLFFSSSVSCKLDIMPKGFKIWVIFGNPISKAMFCIPSYVISRSLSGCAMGGTECDHLIKVVITVPLLP